MIDPLRSEALAPRHGFFTRQGGVSTGPYASLNCSFSGRDDRKAVLENRTRAARALSASPEALLGLTQVHGAKVVEAVQPWAIGRGPHADALVTKQPGLALGIITADCAPVLFADSKAGVIGAAHAGWRGALAGVLEATVAGMLDLGAEVTRIAAAIGPCIRQASYEVGSDLRQTVLSRSPAEFFFAPGASPGRWQFDLPGYCAARLDAAGLRVVDVLEADTAADEARFFSYRRRTLAGGGPLGHQVSIIVL
ncbi:MAG: peptidoglycan editing factor PgeF [Acetobacteraceae bacterium]|nr:peptidoglycan editing factor PgeF [Acetobacteraceae bacterium]